MNVSPPFSKKIPSPTRSMSKKEHRYTHFSKIVFTNDWVIFAFFFHKKRYLCKNKFLLTKPNTMRIKNLNKPWFLKIQM